MRPFSGCFCEIGMSDLISNLDGTMTCMFSGTWQSTEDTYYNYLYGGLGTIGFCLGSAIFCFCVSDRGWACRQRCCGKVQADEETVGDVSDLVLTVPEYWLNKDLNKSFCARHPPSSSIKKSLAGFFGAAAGCLCTFPFFFACLLVVAFAVAFALKFRWLEGRGEALASASDSVWGAGC